MAFDGVLRWSEGRWIAVAWQSGFALLSPSVGLPVAELLFSRLREKSELEVFIRTLLGNTGTGQLEPPSFAVAIADGERWHLVVRGTLTVEIVSSDGNEPLRGEGAATWVERVVSGVTALRMGRVAEPSSPLVGGVVLAEGVGFGELPRDYRVVEEPGEPAILEKGPACQEDTPAPKHGPVAPSDEELLMGDTLSDASEDNRPRRPETTEVVARFCTAGHPNPQERSRCFVCGDPVTGEPRSTERPRLGWLKVPHIEPIPLLESMIIGRHPSADALCLPEPPKLLALQYRHVSGNHLAILLDGWRVLALDLASRKEIGRAHV